MIISFAASGGGGFASVSTGGVTAGAATVVWATLAAAGGASLGFSTRVELCEKLSAALISGARATSAAIPMYEPMRDAFEAPPEIRGGS